MKKIGWLHFNGERRVRPSIVGQPIIMSLALSNIVSNDPFGTVIPRGTFVRI
ncbi:hypothetical protein PROFUN_07592 [Planoprotostelium fungivorum]|uniref:Uncharacterized protein n=1 Tax=Planoprotostelium fungivorum TaxID=1890364 RepID=A0A2P6NLZ8_9EUKA|nr:hypothetical protein PROFUN_07592 [Planoprotostelium fungivorum]